jgi:hypothetical protein
VVVAWREPSSQPAPDSAEAAAILEAADVLARSPGRSEALLFVVDRALRLSEAAGRPRQAALLLGALLRIGRRMDDAPLDRRTLLAELGERALGQERAPIAGRLWRGAAAAAEAAGDVEGAAFARMKTAEAKGSLAAQREGALAATPLADAASALRRVVAMTAIAPTTRPKALFRLGGLQLERGRHDEGRGAAASRSRSISRTATPATRS